MPGRGPAPKASSRTRHKPIRGQWEPTHGIGWQHGDVPKPPPKLLAASRDAWYVWMGAWFAAHWTPEDLPGLRTVVRLYDQVERDEFSRASELRIQMDTYGITPKGQQDRRWVPPRAEALAHEQPPAEETPAAAPPPSRYGNLKVVGDDG